MKTFVILKEKHAVLKSVHSHESFFAVLLLLLTLECPVIMQHLF
jgi:hypothetical protein